MGNVMHPDFICVAAQKTSTGWLYDQASSHPQIWMPPIKELRYFNHEFGRLAERAQKRLERLEKRRRKAADERDIEFLRRASNLRDVPGPADLEQYSRLFEPAGDLMTGDISPSNHRMDDDGIAHLAAGLPACRFMLLLRDPIGRLWSQVNMHVRAGKSSADVLSQVDEFQRLAKNPLFVKHSFQAAVIRQWREVVGDERFRVFILDDLISDPVAYRRAIFSFIGLNGDDCAIEAGLNKKANDAKVKMPDSFRGFLFDYFAEEYEELARLVDSPKVRSWPLGRTSTSESTARPAKHARVEAMS